MAKSKKQKTFFQELSNSHFRVAIFGSARIEMNDPLYQQVYGLAKMIASENIDIVTGGGPGLMEAANKGHQDGRKGAGSHSVGLNIKIADKQVTNMHLDIKTEFERFSGRLDTFMELSNVVIVTPGGVGTLLELAYTWQLVQVKEICHIPIILYGDMWGEFIDWIKKWPMKAGYLEEEDLNLLFHAKDAHVAMQIIKDTHEAYKKSGSNFCLNYKMYKQ
jgi:uncharacterized protein (TIGR00730 family)